MNAKDEILELADGEDILAVCVGNLGWDGGRKPPIYYSKGRVGNALELLDFEFDDSYGGEDGYSLYAWTKTKVILKGTYDGSEWYTSIPRNPTKEVSPESVGGG